MGGKAFEGVTRRIKREEVECTLTWLEKQWPDHALNGHQLRDHLLGSSAHFINPLDDVKDFGDLDLNLHSNLYDQAVVADQMRAILGDQHVKARPGNDQIFTAIPIGGDESRGRVQVDLMFGDHTWQTFSYWSSPRSSRLFWGQNLQTYFKGLYRTEMLKALTAFNSDWVLEEDGLMVARVGPTFFHDRGLIWRYRHRPMRKDGTSRIKELKELSREEFLDLYPSALPASRDVLRDPIEVTKMLLGEESDLRSADTIERISMLIHRHHCPDQIARIMQIFQERLSNLKVDYSTTDLRKIGIRLS
jgi:hypothetical protein